MKCILQERCRICHCLKNKLYYVDACRVWLYAGQVNETYYNTVNHEERKKAQHLFNLCFLEMQSANTNETKINLYHFYEFDMSLYPIPPPEKNDTYFSQKLNINKFTDAAVSRK